QDLQQGFLLIEDLGSRLYLAELNKENADQLYGDAMDALLAMQTKVASGDLLVVEANNPGVIDFQGALHGPVTYDLASLLRDAYVAWPRERVEAWVESYRLRLRHAGVIGHDIDTTRFLRWFDLTGLHRHVRVLGQFYRLWYRDGKPGYLADVPQVYRYVIEVANGYPELADFAALLECHAHGRDLTQVAT